MVVGEGAIKIVGDKSHDEIATKEKVEEAVGAVTTTGLKL